MPGSTKHLAFKTDLAWVRFQLGVVKLAMLERKYSADQPREPAGSPEGGRWAGGDKDEAVAQLGDDSEGQLEHISLKRPSKSAPVDLRREGLGGLHAIDKHVAQSNAQLTTSISARDAGDGNREIVDAVPVGSFDSIDAANRYTSDVLSKNADLVSQVASGEKAEAFLKVRYPTPTGREIYRRPVFFGVQTLFQPTFSVGVAIAHDGSARGWRLRTSFPMNQDPDRD